MSVDLAPALAVGGACRRCAAPSASGANRRPAQIGVQLLFHHCQVAQQVRAPSDNAADLSFCSALLTMSASCGGTSSQRWRHLVSSTATMTSVTVSPANGDTPA